MRLLVFLLIFANLIFFAYVQGYLGGESVSEIGRLEAQVQPDRLHLMWRPGDEPVSEGVISPPEGGSTENVSGGSAENVSGGGADNVLSAAEMICLSVVGLNLQTADDLEAKAKAAKLETRRRNDGSWWVFIPPQNSKEAVDKKVSELRQFGVHDFFIVIDGPQRFAISLGVFSQEEGARRHLEALRGQNVRSAQVGARQPENIRAMLEVRGAEEEVAVLRKQLPTDAQTRICL
ncbi:MAG: hypothetical protein FWH15_09430 [Betaproteobacteria bacterium]|nr:hypothetical protein [Betaproteobacteria bacterium]